MGRKADTGPMSDALRASLFGLNRARLITAAVVLAVGGLLRQAGAFSYPFGPFGLAGLAAVSACAILPLAHVLIPRARGFTRLQLALSLNAAVFLIVGFVTSSLAGRYHESQEHLDAHRRHLSDLQALRDLIFE